MDSRIFIHDYHRAQRGFGAGNRRSERRKLAKGGSPSSVASNERLKAVGLIFYCQLFRYNFSLLSAVKSFAASHFAASHLCPPSISPR